MINLYFFSMEHLAKFKVHGKYVGPGHTGALDLKHVRWNTKPDDKLDQGARDHDWHYATSKTKEQRSIADFELSKKAFDAAKDLSGVAKANAYFVGTGMALKGMVDSGQVDMSGSNPPLMFKPLHWKRVEPTGKPKRHVPLPPLVGIEPNPGPKPKSAGKGKPKNKKKNPGKSKSNSSGSRAGMTMPIGTPVISQSNNVLERLSLKKFKVKLDNIISPSTIIAPNQVFYSVSIDRLMFARTALQKIFGMFAKWKSNGITFEVVPSLATNTAGLVQSVVDPDALDLPAVGTVLDDTYFSGHGKKALEHSVFGEKWTIHLPGTSRQLFTDVTRITPGSQVTDPRNSAAGTLVLASSTGFVTTSTSIGSFYAIVNLDFASSGFGDDDAIVACIKASAVGGSAVIGASTTSFSMNSLLNNAINSSSTRTVYAEATYQQPFFDGTNFYLPRGVWFIKMFLGFTAAPGTCGYALNVFGSPTYSTDIAAVSSQTNTAIPEYVTQPINLSTQTGSQQFMGKLRVTQPSSGSSYLIFSPSFTTTNSVGVVTIEIIVERMATVLSETNCTQFPKGNSSGVIEAKMAPSEGYIVRGKCPSYASTQPNAVMSKADYDLFQQWKSTQAQSTGIVVVDKPSGKDELKDSQATIVPPPTTWWPMSTPRS